MLKKPIWIAAHSWRIEVHPIGGWAMMLEFIYRFVALLMQWKGSFLPCQCYALDRTISTVLTLVLPRAAWTASIEIERCFTASLPHTAGHTDPYHSGSMNIVPTSPAGRVAPYCQDTSPAVLADRRSFSITSMGHAATCWFQASRTVTPRLRNFR